MAIAPPPAIPCAAQRGRKPKRRGPGPPPAEAQVADMRGAIIDAAVACFAARGYALTTNREIAERAGVTSSLLYHYFDSKAAVFRSALADVNQRLFSIYRAACIEAPDAPSMQQLSLGLARATELALQRPEIMRFAGYAEAEIQRHPELMIGHDEGAEAFPKLFRELLQRARKRGELAASIDIDAGVRVLSACFTRLAGLHGEAASHADFAQNLLAFQHMLRGDLMRVPASMPPRTRRSTR